MVDNGDVPVTPARRQRSPRGRTGASRAGTVLVGTVISIVAGSVLAGCGEPRYEYVQKREVGAYLKVPSDWTVIDESTVLDADPNLLPSRRATLERFGWNLIATPGSATVPVGGPIEYDPSFPFLQVIVTPLTRDNQGDVSLNLLRSVAIDIESLPAGAYELVFDGQVVLDNGFHGVQRVVNLKNAQGIDVTFNSLVVVDPATTRIFEVSVVCTVECYRSNIDDIGAIFDSLTIEET
jgi:hypothetical protein